MFQLRLMVLLFWLSNMAIAQADEVLSHLVEQDLETVTCNLNDKYWELIEWFFGRITYVEVTELVETHAINSHFANFIIKQLAESIFNFSLQQR